MSTLDDIRRAAGQGLSRLDGAEDKIAAQNPGLNIAALKAVFGQQRGFLNEMATGTPPPEAVAIMKQIDKQEGS